MFLSDWMDSSGAVTLLLSPLLGTGEDPGPGLSENLGSNMAPLSISAFCRREEEKGSSVEGTRMARPGGIWCPQKSGNHEWGGASH